MLTSSSFRLQKLTKSMEMRSNSFSKQASVIKTPRLSALNSVAKSVKYNNLSFITGQEMCKLRRQPDQGPQDPEYCNAHTNLSQMRKRYDQANQQKMYFQNKINRLNQEIGDYKKIEKELLQNKNSGNNKTTELQNKLQELRVKLFDKDFQKKSYKQIAQTIIHDKIVYDKRKFEMENQLKNLRFKWKKLSKNAITKNEQDDRVIKVYEKLLQKINQEEKERQEHLRSLQFMIMEKHNSNNSSVLRKSQMEQIAEQAMTDKSPEEKEWLKVLHANKMLDKILKHKMEHEMEKFQTVENAFKNIKIATGVINAQTMVKKFLAKEEIYGDLLSKIAENEKEITLLKKQQQELLRQIKQNEEEIDLLQISKPLHNELREELKTARHYDQKIKRCELQEKKFRQFLQKQTKLLNMVQKTQQSQTKDSSYQVRGKQTLKNRMTAYLHKLLLCLTESQNKQDQKDESIQLYQKESRMFETELFLEKMLRVKPQELDLDQKTCQDSGEDQRHTSIQQQFLVQQLRSKLMKSNEKFMKQLQQRKKQQKRLHIETLVKSTKEKPAPPSKKPQKVNDQ